MKLRIRFAEQVVGIFVLLAIIGVGVILVFIGANQRWFARNYSFTSRFASADGLAVGMPIMLKGFEIGKISRITLNSRNEVDVQFSIQDTYYDRVHRYSVLELATSPIGLGVSLKFHSGNDRGPPLPEMSFIPSLDSEEGRELVDRGLVDIPKGEDVIGSVIAKLNPILDETRTTIAQIHHVAGTLDAALNGRGGPMGEMVLGLSATPGKVNKAVDSASGRVDTLLDKLSTISDNLQDITVKTRGVIGDLSTNLDEISQNLKSMTADLKNTQGLAKRLIDPKGSIDTFLNDQNQLYNQVEDSIRNADQIIVQMRSFMEFINGTRPQISNVLEKGSATLDEGKDVLQAVKNNPLLKGGVPPKTEPPDTLKSYRDEDF
ncbi:MAG: MlaD family protein [Spirochaetia bacterium]|jgi:phospholipid/cholesterol/gamma-HCH transport system substrate-binding protein